MIAAVANLISPERHEPTGDIRADLLDIARSLHEKWRSGRYLGLLGTAITERPHHPEVYDAYRERLVNPRRDSVRAVLERGIDEGILAPDVDVEVVIAMFVGSYYATAMADEWDQAEDWPQRIVAVITRTLGLD